MVPRHSAKLYVRNSVCINAGYTCNYLQKLRPKRKSCLVSGNRPGENFLITYPPSKLLVYQNICFLFQKKNTHTHTHTHTHTQKQKAKETKENRKAKETKEKKEKENAVAVKNTCGKSNGIR